MNRDMRRRRRNDWRMVAVSRGIDVDAEEPEMLADPRAHDVRMFADTAGEDEHIESAERRCVGADLLPDTVTIDRDRDAAPLVGCLAREQLAHVGGPAR